MYLLYKVSSQNFPLLIVNSSFAIMVIEHYQIVVIKVLATINYNTILTDMELFMHLEYLPAS